MYWKGPAAGGRGSPVVTEWFYSSWANSRVKG